MTRWRAVSDRSPWLAVALFAAVYLAILVPLAHWWAVENMPGACDENVEPGTELEAGCNFLEDGGYTAVWVVPGALVLGFAAVACWRRRVAFVHLGLLAGIAFLLLATVPPGDYPFV